MPGNDLLSPAAGGEMELIINVTERDTGNYNIKIAGELDSTTYEACDERLQSVVEKRPKAIVIDMSGVTFISSMGIGIIIKAKKGMLKNNVSMLF